jgi:predicted transcriptional regulator
VAGGSVQGFGDLESVIMERLWSRAEPATVRDVLTDLRQHRSIAYTTVLTVMDNLYKKGWLRREPDGRAYRYAPVTSRERYVADLMRQALDDSDDRAEVLVQFVGRITNDEADALREALSSYERRLSEQ